MSSDTFYAKVNYPPVLFTSLWGSAASGNLYSPNPVSGNGRNLGEIAEENNNNNNSQTGSGNSALLRSFRNWLPTFVGGTRNAPEPNLNHRYAYTRGRHSTCKNCPK